MQIQNMNLPSNRYFFLFRRWIIECLFNFHFPFNSIVFIEISMLVFPIEKLYLNLIYSKSKLMMRKWEHKNKQDKGDKKNKTVSKKGQEKWKNCEKKFYETRKNIWNEKSKKKHVDDVNTQEYNSLCNSRLRIINLLILIININDIQSHEENNILLLKNKLFFHFCSFQRMKNINIFMGKNYDLKNFIKI